MTAHTDYMEKSLLNNTQNPKINTMQNPNLANLTKQYQQTYLIYCYKIMQYLHLLAWLAEQKHAENQTNTAKVKPKSASGGKKIAQKVNQEKPTLKSLKHQEKPNVSTIVALGFPNGAMSAAFRVAFNDSFGEKFGKWIDAKMSGNEGDLAQAPSDGDIAAGAVSEYAKTFGSVSVDIGVGFVDGATPDFLIDTQSFYSPFYQPAYDAGEALGFTFITGGFATGAGAGRSAFRYAPRVRMRGLQDPVSHNFPYSFDSFILNTQAIPQRNGYNIYRSSGFLNNKPGNFEIGVTRNNVIDHRFFRRGSN